MAQKKKSEAELTATEEAIVAKSKLPLVFISHDTKDAEIAEAFSKLLSSVSAGVLKSFRSSDKKGTQGIEYGVEWFPEIMKKLDEASDIVCLLTHNSVDRPWILYEAGVAKGKLSTTVLGIAVGIPLNKANNGPFAQFQNCADDEDSLTKLVIQLVRRIPNSEPDEEIIKEQVKTFRDKLSGMLKKQPKVEEKTKELMGDASIAKLFEEVKIMFQDLPSRIDKRLDPEMIGMKRRRRFHPKMMDELFHISMKVGDPNISFLMMISLVKDEMPWLYEIGIETYRSLKTAKTKSDKQKAISQYHQALELMGHPIFVEMYARSEESYMMMKEMRHLMHRYFDQFFLDGKG
ncbi:MAG TPA: toll/interleukin-1 receptor domain-containing protein [Bacteroidia bacterium]|nr:toll/interleukin-1 receptor domain-containing protein [Bacteroidia bacterium]